MSYDDDDYRRNPVRDTRRDTDLYDAAPVPAPYMTPAYPSEALQRTHYAGSSARSDYSRHSERSADRDRDYDRDRSGERGLVRHEHAYEKDRAYDDRPLDKVKNAADKTFSTSKAGLATGVIGALVGGYAMHEASEAAMRARDKRHGGGSGGSGGSGIAGLTENNAQLISTIVGAAIGGLGANAIEKHIKTRRDKGDKKDKKDKKDKHHKSRDHSQSSVGSRSRSVSRAPSDASRRSGASRKSHGRRSARRGDSDSDSDESDWASDSDGGRRAHHARGRRPKHGERDLVISRSPSHSRSRSRSVGPRERRDY